jgi:hypothetical protein
MSIKINGIEYAMNKGDTLVIVGSRIHRNGEYIGERRLNEDIKVEYTGAALEIDAVGAVTVHGNVGRDVNTVGNVEVKGNVGGGIDTKGDVQVGGNVEGGIDTQGDVTCNVCNGDIDAAGDVNVKE